MENKDHKSSEWDIYDFGPSKVDADVFSNNLLDECEKISKNRLKIDFWGREKRAPKGWKGIYDFDLTKVDAPLFLPNFNDKGKKNYSKSSQGRFFTTLEFCPKNLDLMTQPNHNTCYTAEKLYINNISIYFYVLIINISI